jgi:hypothetical protein
MAEPNSAKLKEWRANSSTPPQGKYLLDLGHERHEVDVGYKVFTWNGKTRHISKAFQYGVLLGPLPAVPGIDHDLGKFR